MAYISFRNVVKKYGENEVLKDITFDIEKGEFVTLLGASGCGKSTLLRCMAGLEEVTSGEIIMDCRNITNLPANKRNVGMVFQQYSLFPNMTAEQNVAFGLQMMKVNKTEIKRRVGEVMELVELTGKEKEYPCSLSGGQQQRVAIARALALSPELIFMDEPTSALDPELVEEVLDTIKLIAQEGNTLLLVSHEMNFVRNVANKVIFLENGHIVESGTTEQIFENPQNPRTCEFLARNHVLLAPEYSI